MTVGWRVRPVVNADRAAWDEVYAGYLEFYSETVPTDVLDHVFGRLADPDDDAMLGFVAVDDADRVVGLANVVVHPNTWSTRDDGYLEDLAAHPDRRGQGIGRALVEAVIAHGEAAGWRRIHWHTEQDNHGARHLYDRVGELTDYVRYLRPVND